MKIFSNVLFATLLLAGQAMAEEGRASLEYRLPERQYFISVEVETENGRTNTISFVFDTGAGYTLVSPDDLGKMKVRWVGTETVFLPDGSAFPLFRFEVPAFFIAGCRIDNVQVLAGPAMAANLLGTDVLSRLMPFTIGGNEVAFKCPKPELAAG